MHYDERAWGYGVHTSGVSYHKLIRLGVACNRLGRHQEALEAYAKVLEIRPAHPVALFNLGLTYAMLGKSEEARRQYEALVGRDEELADQLRESLGF
jgi:tetratricopeptide (TPR) repeat protein